MKKLTTGVVIPMWLLGSFVVTALPLAVAVIVVRLLPLGFEWRPNISLWSLLHFVWIPLTLYLAALIAGWIAQIFLPGHKVTQDLCENAATLLAAWAICFLFFDSPWACALAALLGTALLYPLTKLIEANTLSDA